MWYLCGKSVYLAHFMHAFACSALFCTVTLQWTFLINENFTRRIFMRMKCFRFCILLLYCLLWPKLIFTFLVVAPWRYCLYLFSLLLLLLFSIYLAVSRRLLFVSCSMLIVQFSRVDWNYFYAWTFTCRNKPPDMCVSERVNEWACVQMCI